MNLEMRKGQLPTMKDAAVFASMPHYSVFSGHERSNRMFGREIAPCHIFSKINLPALCAITRNLPALIPPQAANCSVSSRTAVRSAVYTFASPGVMPNAGCRFDGIDLFLGPALDFFVKALDDFDVIGSLRRCASRIRNTVKLLLNVTHGSISVKRLCKNKDRNAVVRVERPSFRR
jgi:hypothetical protein